MLDAGFSFAAANVAAPGQVEVVVATPTALGRPPECAALVEHVVRGAMLDGASAWTGRPGWRRGSRHAANAGHLASRHSPQQTRASTPVGAARQQAQRVSALR